MFSARHQCNFFSLGQCNDATFDVITSNLKFLTHHLMFDDFIDESDVIKQSGSCSYKLQQLTLNKTNEKKAIFLVKLILIDIFRW